MLPVAQNNGINCEVSFKVAALYVLAVRDVLTRPAHVDSI
jgi:hypothetical protein